MTDSKLITIPGFLFAGLHCGIKDDPQKKDLALIYSLTPQTTVAGVFTQNRVCAAPVQLCQQNLRSGNGRLIVINSGVANAATGAQGLKAARAVLETSAKLFSLKPSQVYVCSTGKIGEKLPTQKIQTGLIKAKTLLQPTAFLETAEAIRTTDAYSKTTSYVGKLGKHKFHLAIMAKGAGMICPNMATMLCFVVTDLKISARVWQKLLKSAVDETLNCLTVDGDTSTNDTVLALANGLAGNADIKFNSPDYKKVQKILKQLLLDITLKIALDGEGATKCFCVQVSGAKTDADAKLVAKAIGNSPLVKTAMSGCDPNWGRILCAAGYSGANIVADQTKIRIGQKALYLKGKPINKNEKAVAQYLQKNRLVDVGIDLGMGKGSAKVYASDLTVDYVKFNADYHT